MGLAHCFAQAMRHQCSCRDNRLHHAAIDHGADDLPHLRDRHRAGDRHDHVAVGILDHGRQYLEGFPETTAAEGCFPHRRQESRERVDFLRV